MSKIVKDMLVDDLKKRLDNVAEVVVVSLGKLNAQKTSQLRHALRKKNIHLQMVKNSLARKATLDSPLAPAFTKTEGMLAIAWGGEDVFEGFECRGGALDGAGLDAGDIKRVAKWPTRAEQLSILSGQISGLASTLSGQILSVGGTIAGQISSRVDDLEKSSGGEAPSA